MKLHAVLCSLGGGAVLYVVMAASSCKSNGADRFVDALVTPVGDVAAAPADIATENCVNGFAVHAYPSKSALDLARLSAMAHLRTPRSIAGADYDYWSPGTYLYVKDGSAAVDCSGGIDRVTFVLPN